MRTRVQLLILTSTIVFTVLAAAKGLPQGPAPTGVIRAIVKTGGTQEPIVGARVTLTPSSLPPAAAVGTITGRVVDKDGTTPLDGAMLWIDSLVSQNGVVQTRERRTTVTDRDGRYRVSGLSIGRVLVTLVMNNQPVMVQGSGARRRDLCRERS